MTRRYLVLYQCGSRYWSASVPDVPGCSGIGRSLEGLRENMHDGLELHLKRMVLEGRSVQEPFMGIDDVGPGVHAEWMTVRSLPAQTPLSLAAKVWRGLESCSGPGGAGLAKRSSAASGSPERWPGNDDSGLPDEYVCRPRKRRQASSGDLAYD